MMSGVPEVVLSIVMTENWYSLPGYIFEWQGYEITNAGCVILAI